MFRARFFFAKMILFICAASIWDVVPVAAQFSGALPVPDELATGFESITAEQAKSFLTVLAGPTFGGRGTGQVGYTKAAHWVAGKCAEFGLEPRGEGGTYFQMLPMTRLFVAPEESRLSGPRGAQINFENNIGLDRFADQNQVTAKLVVLQISGSDTALPEDLDLRERFVIYVCDEASAGRVPFLIGRKGPAAALRIVTEAPKSSSQLLQPGGRRRSTSVSGTITLDSARQLVIAAGGDESWLAERDSSGVSTHNTDAELTLELRTREESAAVPNVIAWLPGSDPALSEEYIAVGAHLDHLGNRGGSVYPGADDNGSGSTAILSMARALALNPVRPKRSVLFIWFAAEEIGLVGSRHYCDHPLLPLDKTVCMLNIDMVGRSEENDSETAVENKQTMHLIGSKQGQTKLHDAILAANQHINFTFEYDEEDVFGRSDQASFYEKGVAVAFLFGGFHPDYHQPSDQFEKIDYEKIANAARLYYLTVFGASEHGRFALDPSENSGQK